MTHRFQHQSAAGSIAVPRVTSMSARGSGHQLSSAIKCQHPPRPGLLDAYTPIKPAGGVLFLRQGLERPRCAHRPRTMRTLAAAIWCKQARARTGTGLACVHRPLFGHHFVVLRRASLRDNWASRQALHCGRARRALG